MHLEFLLVGEGVGVLTTFHANWLEKLQFENLIFGKESGGGGKGQVIPEEI